MRTERTEFTIACRPAGASGSVDPVFYTPVAPLGLCRSVKMVNLRVEKIKKARDIGLGEPQTDNRTDEPAFGPLQPLLQINIKPFFR